MKPSALVAVAVSCAVLAAVGAGVTSWLIVSNGTRGTSALGGDDGIFVADELNSLLLTDTQVATLGIVGSVDGVSARYVSENIEGAECTYILGQTPLEPAGVRGIEIVDDSGPRFWQRVVQFPSADDAATAFALVTHDAAECATFVDELGGLGKAWTWTTVASNASPSVIAGYSGPAEVPDRVIAVGQVANAVSYAYVETASSSLPPSDLAATLAAVISARLTP